MCAPAKGIGRLGCSALGLEWHGQYSYHFFIIQVFIFNRKIKEKKTLNEQ